MWEFWRGRQVRRGETCEMQSGKEIGGIYVVGSYGKSEEHLKMFV